MTTKDLPSDIKDWIDKPLRVDELGAPVSQAAIENFCAAVGDGNPIYRDELIAPAAMLSTWTRPHATPPTGGEVKPLALHFLVKDKLGFPNAVVTENEASFEEALKTGDKIIGIQSLRKLGETRTNKLGTGCDWTIDVTYERSDGVVVGREAFHFFGYRKDHDG